MSGHKDLVSKASIRQLLALDAAIEDELRKRKVTRSGNNAASEFAKFLFARTFQWKLAANSNSGFNAEDDKGVRYEIKSRRLGTDNESRQLSALRGLPDKHFSYLAGVILRRDYSVLRAAIISHEVVEKRSRYSEHVNAWLFNLDDEIWSLPGVRDVSGDLIATSNQLPEPE